MRHCFLEIHPDRIAWRIHDDDSPTNDSFGSYPVEVYSLGEAMEKLVNVYEVDSIEIKRYEKI
jgi:hypothetical protein